MKEIKPIPQQPTPIEAGHIYKAWREIAAATSLPIYFGIDLAKPGSDYTIKPCPKCGTYIYIGSDGIERHLCG